MTLMKFIPLLLAISGAWLPLNAATVSTTLYSQLGPIQNAWYSDASLPYPQALGDNFQTTASWSVQNFGWRGVYTDNALPADIFAVNVWATGSNGLPTFTLTLDRGAVTRTDTGTQTPWGWNIYDYSLALNQPLLLNPGNYILEVQNNTPGAIANWAWITAAGPQFLYHVEGTWYAGDSGNPQFSIQGEAVPEPGVAALLTLACAAAMGRRRERAQRTGASHGNIL